MATALLAACGSADEAADTAADTASVEGADAAVAAAPEATPIDAGQWTVASDIWKVTGTGPGAEAAQAMKGQKAENSVCVDAEAAKASYLALVEAATNADCVVDRLAAEEPSGNYTEARLRAELTCTAEGKAPAKVAFVANQLDGGYVVGRIEQTMGSPDGSESVTMHMNLKASKEGTCS
ncbi:MAG: DUF3617 family protein [Sphingomonadaceae bacterium]|nr:DUF3617 family protein [Sphingomonadaceae bacterium]MCP5390249.1 DUF3617 family protein [Sphingomonadaceae bacterium]MCP5392419.1 DUF3617 family protein [Sphingomonadaceae bacterium]